MSGIPPERPHAVILLLSPDEITPTVKCQFELLSQEYEQKSDRAREA